MAVPDPSVTRLVGVRLASLDLHVKSPAAAGAVLDRVAELLDANYRGAHLESPATGAPPVAGAMSDSPVPPDEQPFAADTHVRRILGRLGGVVENWGNEDGAR